jgi:helicase
MGPVMRPYAKEIEDTAVLVETRKEELFTEVPNEWVDNVAYEEFLGEIKTALLLGAWIEEASEEAIIEKFNVQPGDLFRIVENAKWLLNASHELAVLLGDKQVRSLSYELLERVSKGIKKELLPIVKLEGVGRTRGRIMYNAGYRTIEDIRHAELDKLINLPLMGPRLAKKIKEQVGGFVKKEQWEKLGKEEEWKQKALTEY